MRLWARSVHKSAACEKVKKNAMSLANTYRDMNNSPRRKTMGDSEKLDGYTEETLKSIGISHEI